MESQSIGRLLKGTRASLTPNGAIVADHGGIVEPAFAAPVGAETLPDVSEQLGLPDSAEILLPYRTHADMLLQTRIYIAPRIQTHHQEAGIAAKVRKIAVLSKQNVEKKE
jgi:hypothetical protein